jgi:hypothetical protein
LSSRQQTSADHQPQHPSRRGILIGFWVLVLAAMPVWIAFDPPGWDLAIYHTAIRALAAGHDPYADAIAIQQLFHSQIALHPTDAPPYSYVYSPITLPLLRLIGALPAWLSSAYWLVYLAGVLTQVWVGMQAVETNERRYFIYLTPVAAFFPGLLANGIVLSGNVAYILYALVFLAAIYGWRHSSWHWFYLAILAASCVKAPLLSLVVIPILSARRQWVPASITTATGIALFAMQPLIWPTLFKHYLQAVELQFSYNRDFGCSPAGLFSGFLYDRRIPYSPASLIFYLCYAIPLFALLVYLSRRFLRGSFSLKQWLPVLLVGVVLLNPRLLEYDVASLTLPLALIAWRFFASFTTPPKIIPLFSLLFVVTNCFGFYSWNVWKLTEGPLLVTLFLAGSWNLLRLSRRPSGIPSANDAIQNDAINSRTSQMAAPAHS